MIIAAIIGSFLNFYYSGRLINYSVKEQLADITPNLLVSIFMGILVYIIGYFFGDQYLLKLIIQIVSCIGIYYLLIRIFKFEAFYEAKDILNNKILPRIRFRVNNITDYE
jgi:Zn-dependent protease with chaperone function